MREEEEGEEEGEGEEEEEERLSHERNFRGGSKARISRNQRMPNLKNIHSVITNVTKQTAYTFNMRGIENKER